MKDIPTEVEERELLGYRLFDICILNSVFSRMICPERKTKSLCFQEVLKHGLTFKYTITCQDVIVVGAKPSSIAPGPRRTIVNFRVLLM